MIPRGTRDFLPSEAITRQRLIDKIRTIFEAYGYNPIETPALERLDVLTSKYAGGAEITKEIYKLQDQGERWLGLRYDFTVPLARLYSQNPQLGIPFKRYQINKCWRDGPLKLGRYREFWQCDVDVVGSTSMLADAESLAVTDTVFQELGLDIMIRVNNRKLLQGILEFSGVPIDLRMTSMLSIDKLEKIGVDGVKLELEEKGLPQITIENVMKSLSHKGTNNELLQSLKNKIVNDLAQEGINELEELLLYVDALKINSVQVDISLARGLEIYTGNVFEIFMKDSSLTSSLAGGGRYDKIIGHFSGLGKSESNETETIQEVPAVGISIGFDTLMDALTIHGKLEPVKTVTKVFVIPIIGKKVDSMKSGINMLVEAAKVASQLRKAKIPTDIDLLGRSISKNLEYANKNQIEFVILMGPREYSQNKIKLRDMKSGDEELISPEQVLNWFKSRFELE